MTKKNHQTHHSYSIWTNISVCDIRIAYTIQNIAIIIMVPIRVVNHSLSFEQCFVCRFHSIFFIIFANELWICDIVIISFFFISILTKNRLSVLFSDLFTTLNRIQLNNSDLNFVANHCSVQNGDSGIRFVFSSLCVWWIQRTTVKQINFQQYSKSSSKYMILMIDSAQFGARLILTMDFKDMFKEIFFHCAHVIISMIFWCFNDNKHFHKNKNINHHRSKMIHWSIAMWGERTEFVKYFIYEIWSKYYDFFRTHEMNLIYFKIIFIDLEWSE